MAMGGGSFSGQDKILPGYYFRFMSGTGTISATGGNSSISGSGGGGSGDEFVAYINGEKIVFAGNCVKMKNSCIVIDNKECASFDGDCIVVTTEKGEE